MPPKSKSNLAQPELAVELKDTWAQTFQLEYDEHSELDRNEIEVFVRNLQSLFPDISYVQCYGFKCFKNEHRHRLPRWFFARFP